MAKLIHQPQLFAFSADFEHANTLSTVTQQHVIVSMLMIWRLMID